MMMRTMNRSVRRNLILGLFTLLLFVFFRWLFGLGIPEIALPFAIGTTFIIMAGLLTGRYLAGIWFKTNPQHFNWILFSLFVFILVCLFLMGLFINKMIEHTQFNYFFFTVIILFLVNVSASMGISMVRNRVRINIQSTRAALAQSKAELQLLQARLSPHFLFNTLNNLYGLSLTEHQKVPELILKLSGLLRYSVYEAKEEFVPLVDEINYLGNYVEFEKMRLGERLHLTTDLPEHTDHSIRIAPMLLIVFVENAFKHSRNNEDERIFITIVLGLEKDILTFSVTNSFDPRLEISSGPKTHSGFGLESVKRRLELLYGGRYQLDIEQKGNSYSVKLVLKTR